jgi:hypothetical protein
VHAVVVLSLMCCALSVYFTSHTASLHPSFPRLSIHDNLLPLSSPSSLPLLSSPTSLPLLSCQKLYRFLKLLCFLSYLLSFRRALSTLVRFRSLSSSNWINWKGRTTRAHQILQVWDRVEADFSATRPDPLTGPVSLPPISLLGLC